eukprot:s424_g14.t1
MFEVARERSERSIKSAKEVARERSERSVKSVLEVARERSERSIKSVIEVARERSERTIRTVMEVARESSEQNIKSATEVARERPDRSIKSMIEVARERSERSIKSVSLKSQEKDQSEMSLDWQARGSNNELEDYVENCCPPDFRPFPGNPVVDAVIEELLQLQLAQQELTVQRWMRLFAPRKSPEASLCSKPAFLKPKAPMEEWQNWNQVLDLFEVPAHGRADRDQLLRTRMLSKDIVAVLGSLLPKHTFSRDGFLHLMCQLKNYRPR